ncbi:2-keto-4-pentenoate hydratase/2-oxohepta-3-ene-1,7-dioic acid hydratase in catechol pathway [Microbacterium sp. W4I4]|uniref:fumarylacetoacetate hydrolase family protein n=1 Tax=Microbacterium sp. W4I4 TaxID=3042295 RepID=UPI002785B6E5|nr:fumarylacetoacetate hydrolase family protein [Microbacterium sp. W4I4]MDQ0615149.1 2-keto-4-pentenoate hydratase/2-oxohepta-3-ene-1,7-dioic acid hydratase in catechol pathway [Microbacterium sp. W4I4]
MKLVSFTHAGRGSWGALDGDTIRDLGALEIAAGRRLGEVLRDGDLAGIAAHAGDAVPLRSDDVQLLPPVPDAQKIICVGLNYADHIAEMKRATPEKPVIFTRFADSLVGDGEALVAPGNSTSFDYEGEFAVVIGREARHVDEADALDHVLGYTIMNDGSIRDYQRHTSQFAPGKNFPRSGSLGPAIVTADEFGAVGSQRIRTRINGQLVQDSTLDQLVFDVASLVSYCSEWTTLRPGDIIATGTPGGVGDGRDPALWLSPGDVIEISIDGLGALTTSVIEEA